MIHEKLIAETHRLYQIIFLYLFAVFFNAKIKSNNANSCEALINLVFYSFLNKGFLPQPCFLPIISS